MAGRLGQGLPATAYPGSTTLARSLGACPLLPEVAAGQQHWDSYSVEHDIVDPLHALLAGSNPVSSDLLADRALQVAQVGVGAGLQGVVSLVVITAHARQQWRANNNVRQTFPNQGRSPSWCSPGPLS